MSKVRTKSQVELRRGAAWFFGGLAVTILTYTFATNGGGGPYMVAWGPVVFGLFLLLKGLIGVLSGDSELAPVLEEQTPASPDGKCPSCNSMNPPKRQYCQTCGRYMLA
ncbi:hypothetical protein [Geothrix alkalitolerans]|uniref:hypothetical protein n=1 Tax=Geothrix alkalitolerans TaxID=2922724 RepID=UPI001FAEAED6|nr:hypothetical protein [Geothrix alkalitolerans]